MGKYAVVYWSGTGNTEAMAEEIAEGIRAAGKQAELFTCLLYTSYLDGARLGYGLAAENTDVTLKVLAEICDLSLIHI